MYKKNYMPYSAIFSTGTEVKSVHRVFGTESESAFVILCHIKSKESILIWT